MKILIVLTAISSLFTVAALAMDKKAIKGRKMKILIVLTAISSLFTVAALATDKKAIKDDTEAKREYQLVMSGEVASCYLKSIGEAAQPGRNLTTTSVVVQKAGKGLLYFTHTSQPHGDRIVTVAAYVKETDIEKRLVNIGDDGYSKPSQNKETEFEVETENKVELLVSLSNLNHVQVRTWILDASEGELRPPK